MSSGLSNAGQVKRHPVGERLVLGEKNFDRLAVERPAGCVFKGRGKITALLEVLIARRPLLPIPALLVGDHDGRQDREFFNRQRHVRQIRNRTVPVLKVEGVEKLLRLLLADFAQRLFHRQRRARVLGHGIGLDLRFCAIHGVDFDRRFRDRGVGAVGGADRVADIWHALPRFAGE